MKSASSGSTHSVADPAVSRLPPQLRRTVEWLLSRWLGRIAIRSAATCVRIELFDRSMTVAAQFFTSIFPILIMVAVWIGSGGSERLADAVNMPRESRSVLDQALDDTGSATFGIVGSLIVLVSATSLSRALTRAFAAIWRLPRPKSRLTSAWRWVAVIGTFVLALIIVRAVGRFAEEVPPPTVWRIVVAVSGDLAVGVFVPWILLSGAVHPRRLLPGAMIFALVMLAVRPATSVWLPRALEVSAERYGSIGVAFTYLAWLYVMSFCFLAASTVGQVLATDEAALGQWIRGKPQAESAGASGPLRVPSSSQSSETSSDKAVRPGGSQT